METKLECEKIACLHAIYTNVLTQEETAESVIPDTMPDIASLLRTEASVYMRSKTVQNGKFLLEGVIEAAVLYAGEENVGIQRLAIQIPCIFSLEDETLLETDKAAARLSINTADTRVLNPRKILFRAEAAADISLFRSSAWECFTGTEDTGELQTLIKEEKITYIAAVEEKNFIIADELTLPAAKPAAGEILAFHAELCGDETRQVGDKIILQGTAQTEVLYLPEGGGLPAEERFSASFSQILDLPGGECGNSSVVLMPTAVYLEPLPGTYGANGFSLEIHASAQTISRAERDIRYIADAYSTRYPCSVGQEAKNVVSSVRTVSLRETVREQIDMMKTPREICSAKVFCSLPVMEDDGVHGTLNVQILCCSENGGLFSEVKKISVDFPMEKKPETDYAVENVLCSEPYLSSAGGAVEIRLPIEVRLRCMEKTTLDMIVSADLDTEETVRSAGTPSLTIVRMGNNSLWSLAKKYGSTIALIETSNTGTPDADEWLLIPRAR